MNFDRIARITFVVSAAVFIWLYGALSNRYNIFPYPQVAAAIKTSRDAIRDVMERSDPHKAWWYAEIPANTKRSVTHLPERMAPGLLLMTGIKADNKAMVAVIDNAGRTVHEWDVDWWRLWPNPDHLPQEERPKSDPGGRPQGVQLMPDGGLVFNFERLGLMRIDGCSQPVWRLPYVTHHSVHLDESGNLWVPGQIDRRSPVAEAPNHKPGFLDFRVLEVSPAGKVLTDIPVIDLLRRNGLDGLLYMSTINNWGTTVSGDTLHLNDVETFPSTLPEGVFRRGDVLISLRNINTVLVFDKSTRKIRYINTGSFVRQHDPDFLDGNRISVFDNNNLSSKTTAGRNEAPGLSSRIAIVNAATGSVETVYRGTPEHPFFSSIIGNHQWLPNGNLLITESTRGRAFEVTADGELVWEFTNVVGPGYAGLLIDVQRLPPRFDERFFAGLKRRCGGTASR